MRDVDFVVAVNNFGDTRSGGLAGPMGLFIILLMVIGTVLLIRNMNQRLRRLPDSFPDPAAEQRAAEIARLDADLERSEGGRTKSDAQSTGSDVVASAEDAEVTGVEAVDAPPTEGDRGERA